MDGATCRGAAIAAPTKTRTRETECGCICRPLLDRGAGMPVKVFGIYLAYAPTVDLQYQGLGRYLAYFLKAAAKRTDVRFVVACPSWTRQGLLKLCEVEGLAAGTFDIVSPPHQPLLLRMYEWQLRRRQRTSGPGMLARWSAAFLSRCLEHRLSIER